MDMRLCGAGFPSIFMPIGASARGGLVFGAYPHPPPVRAPCAHTPGWPPAHIHAYAARGGAPAHIRRAAEQQPTKLTAHGRQSLDAPTLCGVSACGWCNIGATSAQHPRCFATYAVQLFCATQTPPPVPMSARTACPWPCIACSHYAHGRVSSETP